MSVTRRFVAAAQRSFVVERAVPAGTVVTNRAGDVLADLVTPGTRFVAAEVMVAPDAAVLIATKR